MPANGGVPVQIQIPDALEAGVYANGIGIWSTENELTLDFVVTLPPAQMATEEGMKLVHRQRGVARVKIPPGMAFKVIQAINDGLTKHEEQYGAKGHGQQGEPPLYPPPEK